ncbi:MAG: type II/IV secretion system protein, partial [Desulfamplus sp.]|nr:type II/IV secretion system protein [Desulfamplus sp.]
LLKKFRSVISMPFGILLVTGPTGSGKTTTLYAALSEINTPDKKIVTVEDPVEYQMDGVNQVQVQSSIGLTFAHTLRSFLRHDPDVMLIGEIRDGETAEIAVQAALTGHMVFSTLHTNDAAGAVTRLEDMGIERFMISSSLVGVLAQRLVRKICAHCYRQVTLSNEQLESLALDFDLPPERLASSFYRGEGCKACGETGYKGRLGIFELMVMDDDLQGEIVAGSDRNRLFKKAVSKGMISLKMDGIEKVKQGLTTYEEVLRVSR